MKPSKKLAALFDPVLAWLDSGDESEYRFNMLCHYAEVQGGPTNICIVGAVSVFNPDLDFDGFPEINKNSLGPRYFGDKEKAIRALTADQALRENYGMFQKDVNKLFYGYVEPDVSRENAANTIRHWIKTGNVEWEKE